MLLGDPLIPPIMVIMKVLKLCRFARSSEDIAFKFDTMLRNGI